MDTWDVVEEHTSGFKATFGPFASYGDALGFLVETQMPWGEENLKSVTIERVSD